MSDFINEYVASCIEQGKTTPAKICESANEEISLLDQEIKKIEGIRMRQLNLKAVIRAMGGAELKKNKKPIAVISSLTPMDKLEPSFRDMYAKICNFIEMQDPKKLKPREIMDGVASLEENKTVLSAIKWLWDQGMVARDENSLIREISKGKNWDKRPQLERKNEN